MKIEDQVCTLNQALILKTLGVSQESMWYRHPSYDEFIRAGRLVTKFGTQYKKIPVKEDRASSSAFTVAELSQMMPDYYPSWRFFVGEGSSERHWIATVIKSKPNPEDNTIQTQPEFDRYGKTQAEAIAILLIALLETEAITAEEVNKRLTKS